MLTLPGLAEALEQEPDVDRFSEVWRWIDWPGRQGKVDTGIDLVGRLVVTAEIPDGASDFEKERAARRRLVATTGRCPCGVQLEMPSDLKPGTVTVVAVTVEHEITCPAADDR